MKKTKERRDGLGGADSLSDTIRTIRGEHDATVPKPKQRRGWDQENPAFRFRIREQDARRLAERAADLHLSLDAVARALVWAALDALDQGRLTLDVDQEVTEAQDRQGRYRQTVRRFARPAWTVERNAKGDD